MDDVLMPDFSPQLDSISECPHPTSSWMASIHLKLTMTSSWFHYPHPLNLLPVFSIWATLTWVPTSSSSPLSVFQSNSSSSHVCLKCVDFSPSSLLLSGGPLSLSALLCQLLKHLSVSVLPLHGPWSLGQPGCLSEIGSMLYYSA